MQIWPQIWIPWTILVLGSVLGSNFSWRSYYFYLCRISYEKWNFSLFFIQNWHYSYKVTSMWTLTVWLEVSRHLGFILYPNLIRITPRCLLFTFDAAVRSMTADLFLDVILGQCVPPGCLMIILGKWSFNTYYQVETGVPGCLMIILGKWSLMIILGEWSSNSHF